MDSKIKESDEKSKTAEKKVRVMMDKRFDEIETETVRTEVKL